MRTLITLGLLSFVGLLWAVVMPPSPPNTSITNRTNANSSLSQLIAQKTAEGKRIFTDVSYKQLESGGDKANFFSENSDSQDSNGNARKTFQLPTGGDA